MSSKLFDSISSNDPGIVPCSDPHLGFSFLSFPLIYSFNVVLLVSSKSQAFRTSLDSDSISEKKEKLLI